MPLTCARRLRRILVAETLVSEGKPATSDVRGNLGPATVVTSRKVGDWLKDRWQAQPKLNPRPSCGPVRSPRTDTEP